MDFTKFGEYGLIGLIVGALFLIVWRMLIWVMTFVKDMMKQHKEERDVWRETADKSNLIQEKILSSIEKHDDKADERGRYVREEHKQMIETLGRINGHTKG